MRVWHSPRYELDLPGCAFRTSKFAKAAKLTGLPVAEPKPAGEALLRMAHEKEWVRRVLDEALTPLDLERLELPAAKGLADAHSRCVQGTLEAAREALKAGLGLHAGGGSHHAFADHGEGFCVFNDLAAAAAALLAEGLPSAAVVDLDAHQGNGTADILAGEPRAATFSMHRAEGYPENRRAGTVDVELPLGIRDAAYLKLLKERLPAFLDARKPALVLYQAGVDPFEKDELGGLALSAKGLADRDRFVFESCRRRGLPVAVTLGGGYAEQAAELHAATLRIAVECMKQGSPT
jgi:acetoin utilization deacetylase AcuC-like enzyme